MKSPATRDSQLVLILDDDIMVTDGLAAGLEREGRTIITCNDVESAQIIVERLRPSHIVTDVRIPGPFGFEGLDFIRYAKRYTPESRVILMTGDAPEALQLEASERGAVGFLLKPFEIADLESMLTLISSSPLSTTPADTRVIRVPLLDEILSGKGLRPVFQPVVRLDGTWDHVGYEALSRYATDSPLRFPEVLFDYAERKDRVADLEMACIARTFEQGASLIPHGPLFLNLHPEALNRNRSFPEMVVERAARAGIPLNRIVLEITEQGSLSHDPAVLKAIEDLERHGVRFAFDDVGVAYSHLPFMGKIRPSFLKISQHFGTDFETDSTKMKIVMNLLSLSRDFNSELIIEGVESESTAEAAVDLRIPYGQGFFFGQPASASTFQKEKDKG